MRISDWSSDVCSSDLKFHGWRMIALEHRPASQKTRGNCLGQDFLAERLQYRGEPMCHPLDLLDDADVGNTKRDDAMHELRVYRAIAPDGDCRCFSGGRRNQARGVDNLFQKELRSEERRVGKRGVST